ncbi:MAG: GntR family transcriptional regulator [Acidimicrobiia bacterium]|nr:GntR family transcriptional regulator [Acidimicrobiia bacterium]
MVKTRGQRRLRSDSRPIYLQLVDALFDWVNEEGLQPGDRVPGEPELARIFEVGRSTVREALVYLEYEGIVNRSQGSHTTLTSLVRQPAMGLEVLEPVEALAARQGWECKTRDLSLTQRPADAVQARKLRVDVGSDVAIIRRTKFTEEGPFALMESIVPDAVKPYDVLLVEFEDSITALLDNVDTLRFAAAEISATIAEGHVADALACGAFGAGSPVLLLEEFFYGDGEAPLAWNLNYFVPGTIRFELLRKVPNVKRSDRGGEGS